MKIGILTFHWATNYGAVLQSFALQHTIKKLGHEVHIINYKPWNTDINLYSLIRYRMILHPYKLLKDYSKEQLFIPFRDKFLSQTKRIKRAIFLGKLSEDFDCVISGSDQVMNPSFLRVGEPKGSTAYYLGFGRDTLRRVAYGVSFGTTKFPDALLHVVEPLISRFNSLSVREQSGISIIEKMGRQDAILVPDPTLLLSGEDYERIIRTGVKHKKVCYYILHNRKELVEKIKYNFAQEGVFENNHCTVDKWLENIHGASCFITNSFHGCVFSILFHIPFFVVLQTKENIGMNDRFYTLLNYLGLTDRILTENDCDFSNAIPINWEEVEYRLQQYREIGMTFLKTSLQ